MGKHLDWLTSDNEVVSPPLKGEWTAGNTPAHRVPSHGRLRIGESYGHEYAYDFVRYDFDKGKYFDGCLAKFLFWRIKATNCYSWGQPVLSPFDGEVVCVKDGWQDRMFLNFPIDYLRARLFPPKPISNDLQALAGNYIILKNSRYYAFLAHLQNGSIFVSRGQTITQGQKVALIGNSGNSTLPHLHFHLMDKEDAFQAHGIPCVFDEYEIFEGGQWKLEHNGAPKLWQQIKFRD